MNQQIHHFPSFTRMFQRFILIAFLIAGCKVFAHPVHYAVFNLELDSLNRISYSVKTDNFDFYNVIASYYGQKLAFKQGKFEYTEAEEQIIEKYINTYFVVREHDMPYHSELDSVICEGQSIFLYFSINLSFNWKELVFTNRFLIDAFSDQKNLLIFVYMNEEKGLIFDEENSQHTLINPSNIKD